MITFGRKAYRVLAAAAQHPGRFTVEDLAAATNVNARTVRTTISRWPQFFEELGYAEPQRPGGKQKVFQIPSASHAGLVKTLREHVDSLVSDGSLHVGHRGSARAGRLPQVVEDLALVLLDEFPEASTVEERQHCMDMARALLRRVGRLRLSLERDRTVVGLLQELSSFLERNVDGAEARAIELEISQTRLDIERAGLDTKAQDEAAAFPPMRTRESYRIVRPTPADTVARMQITRAPFAETQRSGGHSSTKSDQFERPLRPRSDKSRALRTGLTTFR